MKYIAIVLLLLLGACNSKKAPSINYSILSAFFEKAEHNLVSLNQAKVDTIHASVFINLSDSSLINKVGFIRNIKTIENTEDKFLVISRQYPFINLFSKEGEFISSPFKVGQGPNEFSQVTHFVKNQDQLFVTDGPNARIYEFNSRFEAVRIYYSSNIDYSVDLLNAFASDNKIYYPAPHGSQFLVNEIIKPDSIVSKILPRVVPIGYQPAAVNFYNGTNDSNGNIYFAYKGLPFIIQYNSNNKPVRIIELKDDEMEKYYVDLSKIEVGNTQAGVTDIITSITFLSSDYLLISNFKVMSLIKVIGEGHFEVLKRFILNDPTRDNGFVYIEHVTHDANLIYVSSRNATHIYSIPLNYLLEF